MLTRTRAKRDSEIQVQLTVELHYSGSDNKSEGLSFLPKTPRGIVYYLQGRVWRKGETEMRTFHGNGLESFWIMSYI